MSNQFTSARLRCSLAALLLAFSITAQADWTGSGELGFVFARGNSNTETLNTGFEILYTQEKWSNKTNLSYLRSENDGELDASRFLFGNKTEFELSDRSYITGIGRFDRDRFSSFRFQTSASVGYGYRFLDSERHRLSGEFGPGVRYSEVRDTGETDTNLIARGALDYSWTISETAKLTNKTLIETGSSNTFAENALALEVAINDSMSLKTGVAVRHNTDVEAGRDKTDYQSTINLVYSFE